MEKLKSVEQIDVTKPPAPIGPFADPSKLSPPPSKPPAMLLGSKTAKKGLTELQLGLANIQGEFASAIATYQSNWKSIEIQNKASLTPGFFHKKQDWKRDDQIMTLNMAFERAIKNENPKEIIQELKDLRKKLNKGSGLFKICDDTLKKINAIPEQPKETIVLKNKQ